MRYLFQLILLSLCLASMAASPQTGASADARNLRLTDSLRTAQIQIQGLAQKGQLLESRLTHLESLSDNYRIEKDLLKETYSTNYGIMNFMVAAIGLLFAVLAFIGLKDVNALKTDYHRELVELRGLQDDARRVAQELELAKTSFGEESKLLTEKNKAQDLKIQVLELVEKVHTQAKENNPRLGLELVNRAIELAPDRADLLKLKAQFLNRLNLSHDAIAVLQQAYTLNPEVAVSDLIETYAFTNQFDKTQDLILKHGDLLRRVDRASGGVTFRAYQLYYQNDKAGLSGFIKEYMAGSDLKDGSTKKLNWDCREAINIAWHLPDTPIRRLLLNFLLWCDGQISEEIFQRREVANS